MDFRFATKCIYGNEKVYDKDKTGAISFPIYQTATYRNGNIINLSSNADSCGCARAGAY